MEEITKYEIIELKKNTKPAVKVSGKILEFSKLKFFLLLHGIFVGGILCYQALWIFSEKVTAASGTYWGPYAERRNINPGTVVYAYRAGDQIFTGTTTRNGMSVKDTTLTIRYLTYFPSVSRPATYEGQWLAFQVAWLIFFVITGMIFFIPNETMPANSYFYFTKKKPWIHMIVK